MGLWGIFGSDTATASIFGLALASIWIHDYIYQLSGNIAKCWIVEAYGRPAGNVTPMVRGLRPVARCVGVIWYASWDTRKADGKVKAMSRQTITDLKNVR